MCLYPPFWMDATTLNSSSVCRPIQDRLVDCHAHVTYRDRVATIKYWADVDCPKLKTIMIDDLRDKIGNLLEGGRPKIKLSKFILAPTYRSVDDSDFITNEVLTLLKNKCVEEVLIKEKFRTD
jgi:hypothetical protein